MSLFQTTDYFPYITLIKITLIVLHLIALTTKHQKGIPSEQLRNRFIPNRYLIFHEEESNRNRNS
jgi:hypothetical protein